MVSLVRVNAMSETPGVRRAQDPPASLDGHQPHQRRAAGAGRPHRYHPAVGRRLVGHAVRSQSAG